MIQIWSWRVSLFPPLSLLCSHAEIMLCIVLKLAPCVSVLLGNMLVCHRCHQDKSLYLLYLAIKAILIPIMSLMGVKLWAEQYKPHVPCCSYKPHETKEGGGERRSGAPIQSRYVQIQTFSGRWLGLKHQTTTPKSPCGLSEDKWLSGITEKNESNYSVIRNSSILLRLVFEL